MRTRVATGVALVLGLVMTMGVGTAFAAGGLDDLAAYWSGVYSNRDVYQCAQATGTGQHPDPVFEAPHAIGAVVLYDVDGRYQVYEDVHTGDRLYAPDRNPITTVVKVRWVGVGGYYGVCQESPPTTSQVAPTTTMSQETTTTLAETTTTQEATTTTALETTTSIARASTTTASVAPTTTVAGVTSSTAATTSTTEVTTTHAQETSTTQPAETSTSAAAQVTTTTIGPVSQPPEELPFTGFEMGGLAAIGTVLLAGGALVLIREYRATG